MRGLVPDSEPAFEIAVERHAVLQEIVNTRTGLTRQTERYAFVDKDLAVAPLIRALGGPRRGIDVVRVWSHEMQPERALRVLLWACSKGIIEQVGPPCASDEPRRMAP